MAALAVIASEVNSLRYDLDQALTGPGQMEPSERLAFEERILTGASQLAYAIASIQASARDARTAKQANSATGNGAAGMQETVACLNQLSVSVTNGSKAPGMAEEMLSKCRSFELCRSDELISLPANKSSLKAFLQDRDEMHDQTLSVIHSICPGGHKPGGG